MSIVYAIDELKRGERRANIMTGVLPVLCMCAGYFLFERGGASDLALTGIGLMVASFVLACTGLVYVRWRRERLVDTIAARHGLDPLELSARARNLKGV